MTDISARVPPAHGATRGASDLGSAVIALTIIRDDEGSFVTFRVEAVNESAAISLGVDPEEVRGRLTSDLPSLHFNHEAVERCRAAATTGKDRFRGAVGALLAFFRADPHRARLLVREILDRPEVVRARFERHLRPWTPLLVGYVERGRVEGRVHAQVDAEAWILQLLVAAVGTLSTGTVAAAMFADPPDVDRQLAELVRIAEASLFRTRADATPPSAPARRSRG